MKGLDRYLTQAPEDYSFIDEAIFKEILLPDNDELNDKLEPYLETLRKRLIYEDWQLEKVVSLAKKAYSIHLKKHIENTFWFYFVNLEPEVDEKMHHVIILEQLEYLTLDKCLNPTDIETRFLIADKVQNPKTRQKVFEILLVSICEFKHKCKL